VFTRLSDLWLRHAQHKTLPHTRRERDRTGKKACPARKAASAARLSVYLFTVCLLVSSSRLGGQNTPGSPSAQQDPVSVPKNTLFPVSIPFIPWNGVPVIQTQLNGANQERFAVSTGLNVNTVSVEAYTRLQLQATNRQYRLNVLDTSTTATEARISSLQINMLKLADVSVVLTDVFAMLSPRPHPDAPTGWLGTPFLSAFSVIFDFAHNTIFLQDPKTPLPNEKGTVVVPFTRKDGRIWVKVSLPRAKAFDAVIDTGTVTTLIPTEVAEKLAITPLQIFPITKGNGREARAGLISLPKLNVGKLEATEVRAVFLAAEAQPPFDKTLGVLGMDFLKRYKMTLSFDKQKVAFTPLPAPETEEPEMP
jgi:predicted aspartyl protease